MQNSIELAAAPVAQPQAQGLQRFEIDWIPWTLAFAFIARRTLFARKRAAEQFASVDSSAALEILIVLVSLAYLVTRKDFPTLLTNTFKTSFGFFLAFVSLGVCSAAWSTQPAYSGYMAMQVLSQALIVCLAMNKPTSFERMERTAVFVSIVAVLLGISLNFNMRGASAMLSDFYAWRTNHYTFSAAMLFCYTLTEFLRANGARKTFLLRSAIFAGAAVVIGGSSASIISTIFGVCVASLLLGGRRWPLVIFALILAVAAVFNPEAAMDLVFPWKESKQILSLNGRMGLWKDFSESVLQRPIIGHGYAVSSRVGHVVTNAHNSAFSILLGTGAFGFAICLMSVFRYLREISVTKITGTIGSVGCITAMAAGVMNGMSFSFLGENWRAPSLVFVLFWLIQVRIFRTRQVEMAVG
jgi:O-antigen ligase